MKVFHIKGIPGPSDDQARVSIVTDPDTAREIAWALEFAHGSSAPHPPGPRNPLRGGVLLPADLRRAAADAGAPTAPLVDVRPWAPPAPGTGERSTPTPHLRSVGSEGR